MTGTYGERFDLECPPWPVVLRGSAPTVDTSGAARP